MLLSKSCHHLFNIYSPPFYHLFIIYLPYIYLQFIISSNIYSPYIYHLFINHLFTIYPSIYSVAGSSQSWILWSCIRACDCHQRAQWSDNAPLCLVDDELGSINHSIIIIIARGQTDSWSRPLENWTSILSHLHRLVEAVDGLIGATVLKHISKGSQPQHLPVQWVLGSLDSDSLPASWACSFSIVDTACMSSIVFRASSPLRWICWVVVL